MPPHDAREARVWNYINRQDLFWHMSLWPEWAQTAMLMEHKTYDRRYDLIYFLTANGLDPDVALEWITCRDVVNGTCLTEAYDKHAWRDMLGLIKKAKEGTLLHGNKPMLDMIIGRVQRM